MTPIRQCTTQQCTACQINLTSITLSVIIAKVWTLIIYRLTVFTAIQVLSCVENGSVSKRLPLQHQQCWSVSAQPVISLIHANVLIHTCYLYLIWIAPQTHSCIFFLTAPTSTVSDGPFTFTSNAQSDNTPGMVWGDLIHKVMMRRIIYKSLLCAELSMEYSLNLTFSFLIHIKRDCHFDQPFSVWVSDGKHITSMSS